ncbi:MAG: hypothetical protein ACQEXJ_19375 [Myxococcota bacterium]
MEEQTSQTLADHQVEERIRSALKKRDGVATTGDVAADTGLPYDQADVAMRRMLSVYRSHLDVDDAGNLRYRFDPEMARRGKQPGSVWRRIRAALWKAFVVAFKVWIMVMLVGYTVLFVLILLAIALAGIAAMMRSDDDDGPGVQIGILPFYLLARMLEFLFWWNLFDSAMVPHGRFGRRMRRKPHKKPKRPFYQRIFQYVFGPEEPEPDLLETGRDFARFVRAREGRITAAEWASRSGQSLDHADAALTAGVVRFRGDVDVTEEGVLVYRFDELRVTADEQGGAAREPRPIWEQEVRVPPLTGNPRKSNGWITGLNSFNLVMSSVVLFGPALPMAATIALGVVPFVFSLVFFGVPLGRRLKRRAAVRRAEQENARRRGMKTVFESARDGQARTITEDALPEGQADRLVLDYEGDLEVTEEGDMVYRFPTIAAQYDASRRARESARLEEVVFGHTVFSSDEEEKSLHEAELEEFDRLLAHELSA